jgi:drug/metabolite transporter (DMT)-like permease
MVAGPGAGVSHGGRLLPLGALLLGAAMWGLTWWPLKGLHALGLEGTALIAVGYGALGLALLPVLWTSRRLWRPEAPLVALMVILGGYANLSFASALVHGEVVRVMVLFYLAPVWGVLGGALFLGETIDLRRGLGLVLALAGAFVLLEGWQLLAAPPSALDLLAITAGMAFAGNNLTCRAAQATPNNAKVAAMMVGCGILAWGLLGVGGQGLPTPGAAAWGWTLAYGLGWLFLATAATQYGVTHMEAGRASILLILELVVAVASATVIGGEVPSVLELVGGALIFAAALIEAWRAPAVEASGSAAPPAEHFAVGRPDPDHPGPQKTGSAAADPVSSPAQRGDRR